jgi:general secretion pathway protein M
MKLPAAVHQSRLTFADFWAKRDARERTLLAIAASIVVFAMVYAVLLDPALAGRKRLYKDLPVLRQQVAEMRELAKQAAALSAKSAAPLPPISRENIEAALARSGLKPQNLILSGGYVKVQLATVSYASTMDWLNDIQKTSLLSVVDANIVALPQPDMVNAAFTLRQPSHE